MTENATLIETLREKLAQIPQVKYVDEDWGQLDHYSPHPPVMWPCILIDLASAKYSDIGRKPGSVPVNRQMGEILIEITVANLKTTNSSSRAPQGQKTQSLSIHSIIQAVHVAIHGWSPGENIGKLIREGQKREKRDDGVQEHKIYYSAGITNC